MTQIFLKTKEALLQLKQATLDFLELQQGPLQLQQLEPYLVDLAHLTHFIQIGKSIF